MGGHLCELTAHRPPTQPKCPRTSVVGHSEVALLHQGAKLHPQTLSQADGETTEALAEGGIPRDPKREANQGPCAASCQPGRGRRGSLQQPPGLGLRPPGNRGAPAAEGLLALAWDPIVTGRHAVLRGSRGHRRGVPRVTPSWRPGRSRVLQPPTPGLWRAAPFSLTSARPAPNTGCKRPQTQAAKRKATFPTRE